MNILPGTPQASSPSPATKLSLVTAPGGTAATKGSVTPPLSPPAVGKRTCSHATCGAALQRQGNLKTGHALSAGQAARRLAILNADKRSLLCGDCGRDCYSVTGPRPKSYAGTCEDCGGRDTKIRPASFVPLSAEDKTLMRNIEGGGWKDDVERWGCKDHGRLPNGKFYWDVTA
jgi:hypothetical protein